MHNKRVVYLLVFVSLVSCSKNVYVETVKQDTKLFGIASMEEVLNNYFWNAKWEHYREYGQMPETVTDNTYFHPGKERDPTKHTLDFVRVSGYCDFSLESESGSIANGQRIFVELFYLFQPGTMEFELCKISHDGEEIERSMAFWMMSMNYLLAYGKYCRDNNITEEME